MLFIILQHKYMSMTCTIEFINAWVWLRILISPLLAHKCMTSSCYCYNHFLSDILMMKLRQLLFLRLKILQMTLKRYCVFIFWLHDSNLFNYFGLCGKAVVLVKVLLLMYGSILLDTYWHLHEFFAGTLCSILARYFQCVVKQGKWTAETLV